MGRAVAGRIGEWLQEARDRAFVGRASELALFRAALRGAAGSAFVVFLHGPGGVGKSMLLRRFAAEARTAGRPVVEVDGRTIEATPEAFEKDAALVLADGRAVLLVDTFEACQGLDVWLRDKFLARLPVGALVVIAGRLPPDARWTADPGWKDLLRTVALDDLALAEATDLLRARQVPRERQAQVLAFAGGNPLALVLAAAVALGAEGDQVDWEPSQHVVDTLLPKLIGEVPSPVHRRALEVCAHAYVTTESLLRAVLGDDAVPMFAWLRGLPFVETARTGLFPHDVVRNALLADLRWRDPEGFAELHAKVSRQLFERIRQAPEESVLSAAGALMYLFRAQPLMSDYNSWRGQGELVLSALRPGEHDRVLELATAIEGPASAEIARYWLGRQPEAFRVCRRTRDDVIVGFSAWLRLSEPVDEVVDPVISAVWSHARRTAPVRTGERIGVARFSVTGPGYMKISPVEDLHQWRALAEIARDGGRLAWTHIVTRSGDFWVRYLTGLGFPLLPDRPQVGHLTYTLFARDWRGQSIWTWVQEMSRLMLAGAAEALQAPPTEAELIVLARQEFDLAVRDALRAFTRPAELAHNPLARSSLTVDRPDGLRGALIEAVNAVRTQRGGERHYLAVSSTYLHGTPPQNAVALRLGLPSSTYRRHLATGVSRVCDVLWEWETTGRD